MIMIIVISQSKLLQTWNQRLWIWHTSDGSPTPNIEAMICRSLR